MSNQADFGTLEEIIDYLEDVESMINSIKVNDENSQTLKELVAERVLLALDTAISVKSKINEIVLAQLVSGGVQ